MEESKFLPRGVLELLTKYVVAGEGPSPANRMLALLSMAGVCSSWRAAARVVPGDVALAFDGLDSAPPAPGGRMARFRRAPTAAKKALFESAAGLFTGYTEVSLSGECVHDDALRALGAANGANLTAVRVAAAPNVTDAGLAALFCAAPNLRRVELCGLGALAGGAFLPALLSRCRRLESLAVDGAVGLDWSMVDWVPQPAAAPAPVVPVSAAEVHAAAAPAAAAAAAAGVAEAPGAIAAPHVLAPAASEPRGASAPAGGWPASLGAAAAAAAAGGSGRGPALSPPASPVQQQQRQQQSGGSDEQQPAYSLAAVSAIAGTSGADVGASISEDDGTGASGAGTSGGVAGTSSSSSGGTWPSRRASAGGAADAATTAAAPEPSSSAPGADGDAAGGELAVGVSALSIGGAAQPAAAAAAPPPPAPAAPRELHFEDLAATNGGLGPLPLPPPNADGTPQQPHHQHPQPYYYIEPTAEQLNAALLHQQQRQAARPRPLLALTRLSVRGAPHSGVPRLLALAPRLADLELDGPAVNVQVAAVTCPDLVRVSYTVESAPDLDDALWSLTGMPRLRSLEVVAKGPLLLPDQLRVLGMLPLTELRLDSWAYKQQPTLSRPAFSHLTNEGVKALVDAICARMAGARAPAPLKLSLAGATTVNHEAVSALLRLPVLTELDIAGCAKVTPMDKMRLVAKVKAGREFMRARGGGGGGQ